MRAENTNCTTDSSAVRRHCPAEALDLLEPRLLLSAVHDTWIVRGDVDPLNEADTIVVERIPEQPTHIRAVVGGVIVDVRPAGEVDVLRIIAGRGDDTVRVDLPDGAVDRIIVHGCAGDDVLSTLQGPATLLGGPGDDQLTGGPGDDVLIGGAGRDSLSGGDGSDILSGMAGVDSLIGDNGDDLLLGRRGADVLLGGDGADTLRGGRGIDTLNGGEGPDNCRGGTGRNLVSFDVDEDTGPMRSRDVLLEAPDSTPVAATEGEAEQMLIEQAVSQWSYLFGRRMVSQRYAYENLDHWLDGSPLLYAALGGGTEIVDASGTNVQEAGVDEGDLVETDGQTIYLLSGSQLQILDASSPEDIRIIGSVDLENRARAMYLWGDRLTVLSTDYVPWSVAEGFGRMMPTELVGLYTPVRESVRVTVYDVADPAVPTMVEDTTYDGRLIDSRAVEDRVILVMKTSLVFPMPLLVEQDEAWVYESAEAYRQRLTETMDELAPGFEATWGAGDQAIVREGSLLDEAALYRPRSISAASNTTVVAMDVDDDQAGPTASCSVLGFAREVYASPESLYLVGTRHTYDYGRPLSISEIYKFDLADPEIPLVATGSVPGTVLNQFSMSEHEGMFRIATTQNAWRGPASNNLFVLKQVGDQLPAIGAVQDLAKGERIFSVRFMGHKAYVVTFRLVDPLFAIDLSTPTVPRVAGELKIPGFSTYLHPMDGDHLIGLGRDADEDGRARGLKLSLFDVSDLNNPVESDSYVYEANGWSSSAAQYDHHAFSFFPEYDTLALPVAESRGGQRGLDLFRVTEENGLERLGRTVHDGKVLRSLRIGSYVYSFSYGAVKVTPIDEPARVVGEVAFPHEEGIGYDDVIVIA